MKVLAIIFAFTTICFGILALYSYQKLKIRNEIIHDREKQITEYRKVIEAIARTGDIKRTILKKN